ncbi:alpha/beta-type small acid-soluble spore protein [Bacillaceae bacterium]
MANNRLLVPQAENALERFKLETARELGLDDDIRNKGWENMTTREVGKIGGNMVRKMIAFAERQMSDQANRKTE